MRSFIRFNGVETSVEGVIPSSPEFNNAVHQQLVAVFGKDAGFEIIPLKNFQHPEQTDSIFGGIATGQHESEAPVSISVSHPDGMPFVVPAFIGFRK